MDERATTLRSCAKCSQPAVRVFHVTQHYNRGLPMGKTYSHRCGNCSAQFDTLSWWKSVTDGGFASMILAGGLFLFGVRGMPPLFHAVTSPAPMLALRSLDNGTWGSLAGGAFVALLGGLWLLSVGWQNLSLFRNPPA